ncbi:MAG: hypothetical protein KJZ84_02335 [Bryobacteraceae bacterium]|nr:hypothetical protein [Bryobacteraceae bacterium]
MTGGRIIGGALATVLVLVAFVAAYRVLRQEATPVPLPEADEEQAHASFIYGRITTVEGATYEGRLRWGGGEEAFWGDYFNGVKKENPWAVHVPPARRPAEQHPFEIFGLEIFSRRQPLDLGRPFMARFGDLARIEARGRDVFVTLKSGTTFKLDRFSASDFDDGVRVWGGPRGAAGLDSLRIRTIELLPAPSGGPIPDRLHGAVRTQRGEEFTGFVQWDRTACLGGDEITGQVKGEKRAIRFDAIRSIERVAPDSVRVKLRDGGEAVLSGEGNRGVYVDDPRYGRVQVSWNAFASLQFSAGGSGPAYGDFPLGGPLKGRVTTGDGRRITGRLVYDLDESEVTETLDAPSAGVDYTIPFGLIGSILLPAPEARGAQSARVMLHSGESLELECAGDLGEQNGGMLIFIEGRPSPEYVPWNEVGQIDLDRPPAMYQAFRNANIEARQSRQSGVSYFPAWNLSRSE